MNAFFSGFFSVFVPPFVSSGDIPLLDPDSDGFAIEPAGGILAPPEQLEKYATAHPYTTSCRVRMRCMLPQLVTYNPNKDDFYDKNFRYSPVEV